MPFRFFQYQYVSFYYFFLNSDIDIDIEKESGSFGFSYSHRKIHHNFVTMKIEMNDVGPDESFYYRVSNVYSERVMDQYETGEQQKDLLRESHKLLSKFQHSALNRIGELNVEVN